MPPPRLLDQVRAAARLQHLSLRTERAYVGWVRRFVRFHGLRHPRDLGAEEVRDFLSYLVTERNVAASTQNQALAALLFLYRTVLDAPLRRIEGLQAARKPRRLPAVLRRDEVRAVLRELSGTPALVCALLYGSGLRLLEALRLRVKDVDLEMHALTVRGGEGTKGPHHGAARRHDPPPACTPGAGRRPTRPANSLRVTPRSTCRSAREQPSYNSDRSHPSEVTRVRRKWRRLERKRPRGHRGSS